MFCKLQYFKHGSEGICALDFKESFVVNVNLSMVMSLSSLRVFEKPLTGTYVGKYAVLTMVSGDVYYLYENSYYQLANAIGISTL